MEKTYPARVWVVWKQVYGMDDKPIRLFRHNDEQTARQFVASHGGYLTHEIRQVVRPSVAVN